MRKLLITYSLLLLCVLAWAQSSSVATKFPYEFSFEENEDFSPWTLNYGTPNATDKWMYGTAVHNTGKRSLYVSSDGQNPVYGRTPNITVAMLKYKFPTATSTQKYTVSFDWKGMGDSTTSRLYLLISLEEDLQPNGENDLNAILNAVNTPGSQLSNKQINACEAFGESGEKFLCGSEVWQNVSISNVISVSKNSSKKTYAFVFIWVNANTADTITKSSIAIDNFQINTSMIQKPTDLIVYPQCADSSLSVTWDGKNASAFDIQFRKIGEISWKPAVEGLTADYEGFVKTGTLCSYPISLKKERSYEGSYEVRVRGKSDTLVTPYVYVTNILIYCPENHCINYVDLYGSNVVCTTGMHEKHTGQTPYDVIGVVDYGPDSQDSRHTLHVDPTETDPRTDNMLHTVPAGAMASVRLGNWNASGKAQSITYNLTVDTANQGILIMKYAVVLDNSGHGRDEEPYFRIEIKDEHGKSLEGCGDADFAYSDAVKAGDTKGWHLTTYQGNQLAWKEWTSVGIPLLNYDGQTIQVRITSADCGQTVHYGYGYFILDCANAHIETDNCGNDAFVSCTAPEGFNYMWYKNNNPDSVVSRDQTLNVDASRTKYTCRVSFIEEPDCWFEISTTSEPRFPVPDYTYKHVYGGCSSYLDFTNTSHVMNKFDGIEHHTSERTNDTHWIFHSLTTGWTTSTSDPKPTFRCANKGDTVEVTCTTYIGANNSCDSMRIDTLIVPSIVPEMTSFTYKRCSDDPVYFDNQWFNSDTVYVAHGYNFAGCDSTSTLYLKVYPPAQDQYIHDSICSDQSITINGIRYNQPLENHLIMLKTKHGCDSALYLTLTVNERINADIHPVQYACADAEQLFINFDIHAGQYDSLGITFSDPVLHDTMIYQPNLNFVSIPYSENITPGNYSAEITFYQFCCGQYVQKRDFEIRYRSSIVEQKWNDVLTVLSPQYNGGYEFTAFQWYKDGVLLPGETHSYLYQPLDANSEYYVELTRPDGLKMTTCPIHPVHHEDQTPYPTIVTAGKQVPMYMMHPTTIWYYTVSGQLVSTFGLPQGYTELPVPEQKGAYIIKSVNTQGETQAQVIVVE